MSSKSLFKKLAASAALAGAGLFGVSVQAGTVYTLSSEGFTFSLETIDNDNNSFYFTIAGSGTGGWANANYLGAFGFKDIGIDFSTFTSASLTQILQSPLPAGNTWTGVKAEINADGCNTKSSSPSLCFTGAPPLEVDTPMKFLIDISGATLNIPYVDPDAYAACLAANPNNAECGGPHLKVQFMDLVCKDKGRAAKDDVCDDGIEYVKAGSLLSTDMGPGRDGDGGDDEIPEPGSLALMGLGLAVLAASRRRLGRRV